MKRISDQMEDLLNRQMTREAYQAQVYLAYGAWAEANSFPGIATFLYGHMQEEREHMFKILKYILDRGGEVKVEALNAAPACPTNIGDCLQHILQHEIENSKQIDKIVRLAHDESDWATFNFGQWFVQEQIEEETLINGVIDKYNLASTQIGGNHNLYEFDKDLASASQEATTARDETLE
ncbi:dolichol kinase [Pelobium manganitolerans]|uniref:Ferritin n=1 Tax=Pelobium manganitolerans TaxID=1842495 RepID=A0A419S2C8_9SPHI|nr:ferritin [Pelobium manganitolerans]RKD12885.1 dolichol kinase [Pelobium manganitolerans]